MLVFLDLKLVWFLQYPLISNSFIYTKLGANNYTVDYTINNVSKDDSDVGFEASLGIENRFNSGLGLNVEYRNINNPIINANQFMVGMSYKF
ncbi:outer membrane beta-barrel protein [Aliivibrio wodanis]|uniref:outer membrane beta-barrel protein n=1 Tax=Aliivibrio wodanis TaxID=80852 RepID=UPI00406C2977